MSNSVAYNVGAAWRRLPNGRLIFAQTLMAAFAKPLVTCWAVYQQVLKLKTK